MCRFLPPPGRQQNRTGNLRYLVFVEIRKNFEKDEKKEKCENPIECANSCRLRDGNNLGRRISITLYFLKFAKKLRKIDKIMIFKNRSSGWNFAASVPSRLSHFVAPLYVAPSPTPSNATSQRRVQVTRRSCFASNAKRTMHEMQFENSGTGTAKPDTASATR